MTHTQYGTLSAFIANTIMMSSSKMNCYLTQFLCYHSCAEVFVEIITASKAWGNKEIVLK